MFFVKNRSICQLLAITLFTFATTAFASAATSAACTATTAACTEWVSLGAGNARSRVYRTYPLKVRNPRIRRALIMVHGALRNADMYFRTATAAAFLGHALADTIVIAPQFASADGHCHDTMAPNEVSWPCSGNSWRAGGVSPTNKNLTSFDFMDTIIRELADKRVFPNLSAIVVAGHSAGGQFADRYAMANHIDGTLGVSISYVVANPSSYAWPDATRPEPVGDGKPANAKLGWKDEDPHTNFSYGPSFNVSACPDYDRWPYGMEHRTSGYTVGESDDQLRKQLAARRVTYLLSQVDTLPLGGFDSSCQAMAQGATRRARGEAFAKYMKEHFGAGHHVLIVPECPHNARCVYTTDEVLPVIFPEERRRKSNAT